MIFDLEKQISHLLITEKSKSEIEELYKTQDKLIQLVEEIFD